VAKRNTPVCCAHVSVAFGRTFEGGGWTVFLNSTFVNQIAFKVFVIAHVLIAHLFEGQTQSAGPACYYWVFGLLSVWII
jgi:hypothetical protein